LRHVSGADRKSEWGRVAHSDLEFSFAVGLVVFGEVLRKRLKSFAQIIYSQTELGLDKRYNLIAWHTLDASRCQGSVPMSF
jgi:hypothetical protein